jgi:hypothetical protein
LLIGLKVLSIRLLAYPPLGRSPRSALETN